MQASWLYGANTVDVNSVSSNLSLSQSDHLVQAFISNVDQSVRVLHKPTLLKKLNQFRRGVLSDACNFEIQLAAVYSLALLSLPSEDCLVNLGEPRQTLMARFLNQVERGLQILRITTTHKWSSLQTLILHIVRPPKSCRDAKLLTCVTLELPDLDGQDSSRELIVGTGGSDSATFRHSPRWHTLQFDPLEDRTSEEIMASHYASGYLVYGESRPGVCHTGQLFRSRTATEFRRFSLGCLRLVDPAAENAEWFYGYDICPGATRSCCPNESRSKT